MWTQQELAARAHQLARRLTSMLAELETRARQPARFLPLKAGPGALRRQTADQKVSLWRPGGLRCASAGAQQLCSPTDLLWLPARWDSRSMLEILQALWVTGSPFVPLA